MLDLLVIMLERVGTIVAGVISFFLVVLFFAAAIRAKRAQIPLEDDVSGWSGAPN